jgi:hypothetical protein
MQFTVKIILVGSPTFLNYAFAVDLFLEGIGLGNEDRD